MDNSMIPNYTADDYLKTSAPYEFLHDIMNDKFLFAQVREAMKIQARSVGVNGFIGLWNSFVEGLQTKKGLPTQTVTSFDEQEVELLSGKYVCTDKGVVTADRQGYDLEVCKHPILPVQRLVNIDTQEERLRIAYKKGNRWRSLIAEKTTLASSTSILNLAANGVFVNNENAKALSTYLFDIEQMNYNTIPEQNSVGRLGWVGEYGFSPYVDNLVFDGENSFKHIYEAVKPCGDFEVWKQAMSQIRQNGTAARIYLAASFASVLVKPLGLLPFFVHLWGGTENGKTVALMIAASVWANPRVGEYVTTFNSTAVAQELQAGFLNSLPMCLDELQIQTSQGIKDFDKIIYQLTEGVGRSRGAKTGGLQKNHTWKNCILTNGESPISNVMSGGGAVNRIIEFECTEKIYSDLPKLCDIITLNYGYAGKMFIDYLQNKDGIELAKKLQKEFYIALTNTESTEKQASSASVILTADFLINKIIFQDDLYLSVDDLAQVMTKKNDVDINRRAYEFIFEWFEQNKAHFIPGDFGYTTDVWGCVEANNIYVIKSVFDREMKTHGFNGTSFLSWCKRNNKIIYDRERHTKRKRMPERTQTNTSPINCVCFIKNDDFEEIDNSDGAPF